MSVSLPNEFDSNHLVDLVRQAQAGSDPAATALFERCREPLRVVIRRVIYPQLRKMYDSDDFLLETFQEIFTRHFTDEVLASPQTLWPYLRRIAENKVRDAKRKYLASKRWNVSHEVSLDNLSLEEELWCKDLSPEDSFLLKELVEDRLVSLIEQQPLMLQRIIRLLLQGCPSLEIAHSLNVEAKRVYRAIKWLEKKIRE